MTESNTIKFDEIKCLATINNQTVTLNPLSYKLLYTLVQRPQEVVSTKSLMTSVWPNSSVSPDTLKQRVFVLRKSLEQSTIKGVSIQAVRGEGYRLLVEETSVIDKSKYVNPNTSYLLKNKLLLISFAVILMVAALLSYLTLSSNNDKTISNNRLALWTNVPPNDMSEPALSVYQTWSDLLSQSNNAQRLQLIFSNQRQEFSLPVQARKDRVALISYFEVIHSNNKTTIKLSIIEPTTATILRTDIVPSITDGSRSQTLTSQLDGIEKLLSSGKLYLNKEQREYAKSPIWTTLKALANPS